MALELWRVTHKDYVDEALTGEGARLYGGRFNSPGNPVIYASGTLSLAVLELLVQANDRRRLSSMAGISICIPEALPVTEARLPAGWDAIPYSHTSVRVGDQWLEAAEGPVLKVPSVVIPSEFNYLINPLHPDFQKITVVESRSDVVDPRLVG